MSLKIDNYNSINNFNVGQIGQKSAFKTNKNEVEVKEVPVMVHCDPHNENGKSLFSVGNVNGTSMTVYKPENFDKNNPIYLVRFWDADGNQSEIEVEINKVNPSYASYVEMFAYSVYCQHEKGISNAAANFIIASRGVDGKMTYDDNLFEKRILKKILYEFMQRQYNCGNFDSYWKYRKLYDNI